MKKFLFCLFILLLFAPISVFGQTPIPEKSGCSRLTWDANTEADLDGYEIKVKKDGVQQNLVQVGKAEVEIACSLLPITAGATYSITMKAFDVSKNYSADSASIDFRWPPPDTTAPDVPKNGCVIHQEEVLDAQGNVSVFEVKTCWSVTPTP